MDKQTFHLWRIALLGELIAFIFALYVAGHTGHNINFVYVGLTNLFLHFALIGLKSMDNEGYY